MKSRSLKFNTFCQNRLTQDLDEQITSQQRYQAAMAQALMNTYSHGFRFNPLRQLFIAFLLALMPSLPHAQIPFFTPAPIFSGPEFLKDQQEDNQILLAATWQILVFCLLAALLASMVSIIRRGSESFRQGWFLSEKVNDIKPVIEIVVPDEKKTGGLRQLYNTTFLQNIPWCKTLTLGQSLICAIFLGLIVVMSILSNPTPLQNPRRFGYLALISIVVAVLLSMKNGPLSLAGMSYEKINFLHKFVGRVVTAAVTVHGGLFLKMYLDGVIKISLAMYTGGGMWIALVCMSITSFRSIRNRFYGLFYWVHLLGYSGIFGATMFHSPLLRPYIISAILLHTASTVWQLFKANKINATLTALPGKFVMIEIPGLKSGWKPGQHIRIRLGNFSQILQAHPFTIATSSGNHIVLYIKVSGRFTRTIYTHAERAQEAEEVELKPSNHSDVATLQGNETTQTEGADASEKRSSLPLRNSSAIRLLVQGPYGGMGPNSMKDFGSVFLCVGGSGISYLTSTLMDIVTEKMNGRCSTKRIKAFYVSQEWDAAQYFGNLLRIQMERAEMCGINFELQIFVTKQEYSRYSQRALDGIPVSWSRPKVNDLLREFLKTVTGGWGVGCGVCGPRSLSADLRKAVGGVPVGEAKILGGITFYSADFL